MRQIIDQLVQYYGTDWIGTITTIVYLVLIGNKKKSGFIFGIIASFSWMLFGWLSNSLASMIANCIFIYLNIRGLRKWGDKNR